MLAGDQSPNKDLRDPPKPLRKRCGPLGVAALVVALIVLSTLPVVIRVFRPGTDRLPARTDAVVVFAGETERVRVALELMDKGVADALVVSLGRNELDVAPLCGQREPIEVLCPQPAELNTKSEAEMFGALAEQRGWAHVVAVTGDYHVARARMWTDRCIEGSVTFVPVVWGRPGLGIVAHEFGGLLAGHFLDRGCCSDHR